MPLDIRVEKAELRNVNLGNEGSGDGQISRLDLKLLFSATSDSLTSLLNCGDDHQNTFWREGIVIEGLGEVEVTSEWSHNKFRFGILESLFDEDSEYRVVAENVTVKNAKLKPMPNHLLEISITAQIRDPSAEQHKRVADFQKKDGGLVIEFDDSVVAESSEDDEQQEAA